MPTTTSGVSADGYRVLGPAADNLIQSFAEF